MTSSVFQLINLDFSLCLRVLVLNIRSGLRFSFLVFSPKYWREIKTDDKRRDYRLCQKFLNTLSAKCSYLNEACGKIMHTIYSFKL